MKLADWRSREKLTQAEAAERFGVTGNGAFVTISRYERFERIPSLAMLRHIERVTNGAVTIDDWPDCSTKAPSADQAATA